jgi:hypothetical protein
LQNVPECSASSRQKGLISNQQAAVSRGRRIHEAFQTARKKGGYEKVQPGEADACRGGNRQAGRNSSTGHSIIGHA